MANSTTAPRAAMATAGDGADSFDRRNVDWYVDKAVQVLVFVCGISAIIFVLGIFVLSLIHI